ncbi:galactose-binding domain-like protein [Aspergillus pseudodeflectus]|uniref:Galactose-binding domain-like protein n=1 Tax=Aspergillus pseudodeflectus TaxID=176178 RepID=A0ABR4JPV5_9EURO
MKTKRAFITALVDRLAARQLGFPPETRSYTVQAVSDEPAQFELAADLYQPVLAKDKKPAGTILIRCPYGRGLVFALLSARPYAARGYQCLLVSCRGTFGSGGKFDPWRHEEEDGRAVVQWMRKQDLYTGSFATLGGSYLGFVQWALLRNPPPDMVAAVIQCAPHDFSQQLWGTGSLALEWICWGENMARQEETGIFQTLKKLNTAERMRPVLDQIPLAQGVKAHFEGRASWLDFVSEHPDTSDPYYRPMQLGEALERADILYFWLVDANSTTGGNLLLSGGATNDTTLAARSDVLTFTTEVLEKDVEISGKVIVELSHSSDNPNADLFIRVSEVDAKGQSHNITETYKRFPSGQGVSPVILHLNDCAHRFVKGSRIRLIIAGGSHPQFAINTGNGVGVTSNGLKSTIHTIVRGEFGASRILLPTVM